MFAVSEVCKKVGIARSTLLYYERIGMAVPVRAPVNGYRQYTPQQVERLLLLRQLQKAGFSLKECRKCLDGELEPAVIAARLQNLEQKILDLKLARDLLHSLYSRAVGKQPTQPPDGNGLRQWHAGFEKNAPEVHFQWLKQLGFTEKDALYIRWVSRNMTTNDDYMKHFFEIFENMKRQGPGSAVSTLKSFRKIPPETPMNTILEVGCGKGSTSLLLARESKARVFALDNHPPFLAALTEAVEQQALKDRVIPILGSMFELQFPDGGIDLIWSEGSAYIMGFEKALTDWKRLIRNSGFLFVSDLIRRVETLSPECREYFDIEYPNLCDGETRIRQATALGYDVIDSFILPHEDWQSYYDDIRRQLDIHAPAHGRHQAFLDMEKECRIFDLYGDEFGYLCLLMRKR